MTETPGVRDAQAPPRLPGTHLEEIRGHQLLHQVALHMLSGTLREGLAEGRGR